MRLLLVEDDEALVAELTTGLTREGFAVDIAMSGDVAIEKAALAPYDVIVLDRDLPIVHGDRVCASIVASESTARIIMLTASGSLDDRVSGLGIGADDYLPKPFAIRELVARIRALGRRGTSAHAPILTLGDITIDTSKHQVMRAGRICKLTRKEFGILEVLAAEPGRVVSAEELLDKVWDEFTDPFTNTVRVTMMTLRRKLGEPNVISTIKGVGYQTAIE